MEIGLGLGANMGNRLLQLQEARKQIVALKGVTLLAQSHVYETEPVNVLPTDMNLLFLNAALVIDTPIEIAKLWPEFQRIQTQMGRPADSRPNARRPIDIDIIYADALSLKFETLVIPHPRWAGRRFVVVPFNDIRPNLVIPGQAHTIHDIMVNLSDQHRVVLYSKNW